eukprot:TRINITY_DN6589_c0_g1_i2.p1 TRINITY_DN6589_c0_g1~~TRINITY_DN6589_c0_g1_i2.p1  ORF type:complete len:346 (+),score=74.02 TRINITY_DN6589_c0_g1_i2:128-1165(+)
MEIPRGISLPPISNLLQYNQGGASPLRSMFNTADLVENESTSFFVGVSPLHLPLPLPIRSQPIQTQIHPIPLLVQTPNIPSNTSTLFPLVPILYSGPIFSQVPLAFSTYPPILPNQAAQCSGGPPQLILPTLNTSSSYETLANPSTPTKCPLVDCLLCKKGPPASLARSPSWISMLRMVLFCLSSSEQNADNEYFSLKDDVYEFIVIHWRLLCGSKTYKGRSWHKQVQDTLSHTKDVFESGANKVGQKGFWKLKMNDDPWTTRKIVRGSKAKSNTTIQTSSSSSNLARSTSDSHINARRAYKRGEKNARNGESDSDYQNEGLQKRRRFPDGASSKTDLDLETRSD